MYPNALGNGLTPEQAVSLRSSDDDCDMGAEDRCGYVVRPADAGLDSAYGDLDDEWWYERGGFVCCWREPWRGTGRCVWHADVEDKPVEALRRSRKPVAERLDGARLVGVTASDELLFARCDLLGVDFSDADLSRGANRRPHRLRAGLRVRGPRRGVRLGRDSRVGRRPDVPQSRATLREAGAGRRGPKLPRGGPAGAPRVTR